MFGVEVEAEEVAAAVALECQSTLHKQVPVVVCSVAHSN